MKCSDGGAIRSAEAQMAAALRNNGSGLLGDREFHAGRAGRMAVIGALAFTKIDDAHEPKRPQGGVVKPTTTLDVSDPQGDVIQHGKFPQQRWSLYGRSGANVTVSFRMCSPD